MKNNNKKTKFKNPLSALPIRSLIITLSILLVTFSLGFGVGFTCSSCSSESSFVLPVYAREALTTTSTMYVVDNSGNSFDFSVQYTPVYPSRSITGAIGDTFDFNSLVGFNFAFSSSSPPLSDLTQLFLLNGYLYELRFPTRLTDNGSATVYNNRFFTLNQRTFSNSAANVSLSFTIPLFSDNLFYPNFGVRGFSYVNPSLSYGYSLSTLPSGSLKTNSSVLDAISTYGNPTYVLPVATTFRSIIEPVSVPVSSDTSLSFSGASVVSVLRFYFGSFTGNSLPDLFADLKVMLFTNVSSSVSTCFPLFGTLFDSILLPVPSDLANSSYNSGYNAGRLVGYDEGLSVGRQEVLENVTPWQHIVNGVNTFLRLEILPNVRVSVILTITFGLILVGFLLKFYLGG